MVSPVHVSEERGTHIQRSQKGTGKCKWRDKWVRVLQLVTLPKDRGTTALWNHLFVQQKLLDSFQNLHPSSKAVHLILPICLDKWLSLELLCGVFSSNESMSPLHLALQPSNSPPQLELLLYSKSTPPATMEQSTKRGEIHLPAWENTKKPVFCFLLAAKLSLLCYLYPLDSWPLSIS